jgi:hypothetical protein
LTAFSDLNILRSLTHDMQLADVLGMVVVGALWGCTNCFLRSGAAHDSSNQPMMESDITTKNSSRIRNAFRNLLNTLLNWRFTLPFALNQSGSLVYYYLLGNSGELDMNPLSKVIHLASKSFKASRQLFMDDPKR